MKIFQTIYANFFVMGFTANQQQGNQWWQLSSGQIIGIVKCIVDVFTLSAYVFHKANYIDEYMEMVLSFAAVIGFAMGFISIISKNDKLFHILELVEQELTLSKC